MGQALTSVFFVLCALASVCIALPAGPTEAYCVDLTTGKTSVLPGDTTDVWWTKKPTLNGGRCNLQGVLRIKPPSWAKSVSFHMEFEKSTNWSFNIGDSRYNSGLRLHSGPSEAYCVDLTTSKTSVLPGDTDDVVWTKKPTSNGGQCNLQGVLKITPPCWAKSVSFHMAFEKSDMWSFNIGNSPTNNGWAGDSGTTRYDAEIHSMYSDKLYVYRSDVGGSTLITSSHSVKTAMLIRLSRMQMYVTNYEGYNYYRQETGLFAFDTMYMGLNRVVANLHGSPSGARTGRGLCSVCIYFLKDTVGDLHGHTPVMSDIVDPVMSMRYTEEVPQ
ncbi:hypothetical protein NP493_1066g02007 [Ridgeia piscesae]|uniref:Uncharacterized protein n=1 Tax=Ridgeia piscesae TaxID=27915 RepID=A0AAD9NJZ3_RIDPI|nr:hypothetical protein NP493_1066g02007 [Ridgeia piscesae]